MDGRLFWRAMILFACGLLLVGLLLFLPAGSFAYWQGWLLIGILFVPMFAAGLVMMAKSPELLRRRLNAKEEQGEQKQVIAGSGLMFLASFILAGLNFRFGWLSLPRWLVWTAAVLFLLGYLLYASIFAAIGSAVENEGDSQQLQLPVTIPLLLGFFIALYAYKAPDSALVFWGSMIPFTSPIVMLARIPFGVPVWELVVSLAVLFLTFVLFAYLSAKVYKVGILMFGKKSSWKDLWKWLKQK